uniref:Uncharacterized protein n=1 Tax=Globodera rostochiensis TaxID=31243 RepID=A0A914HJ96_GLORO
MRSKYNQNQWAQKNVQNCLRPRGRDGPLCSCSPWHAVACVCVCVWVCVCLYFFSLPCTFLLGIESVQHLCRALNAANRKIATLQRQLQAKEEELSLISYRPTTRTKPTARRALSLDQLTPNSKTCRVKEIADKLQQCFQSPLDEVNKFLRLARHQADFKSPKKAAEKRTKKGRTRPTEKATGRETFLCMNVKDVLTHRVETLWKNGKLNNKFDGKFLIALLGDRGGGSVKIGLQIGNLQCSETRSKMELRLGPVLEQLAQLRELTLEEAGTKLPIEWFLCGDMSFICACRRTAGSSKHTTADSIASGSQKARPLFPVPPVNVIPSPFHTLHSAGRKCIDFFEMHAKLAQIMAKSGVIRHAKTQEYTRHIMKRLLCASAEIRSIGSQFAQDTADLLDDISELHQYGQATIMMPEQISTFGAKCFAISSYFRTLRACHHGSERVGNIFTPKLHWLLGHGPDFARRWGWFGWLSEQGIEHLHHVLNKQAERFKHFKGDQLLLKIGQNQTLLNEVFDRRCLETPNNGQDRELDTMVNEFSSLTSATRDIISKLRIVSERAAFFVDSAIPVGVFIARAAEIAFEPDEEELKAIKTLHEFVKTQLDVLSKAIEQYKFEFKYYLIEEEYTEKIKMPLGTIEGFYIDITDPLKDRSNYKDEFIAHCNAVKTSPLEVLVHLKESLMTSCNLKSNEETEGYVAVLELFQKIEQQHLQNLTMPMEEYEFIKSSLLAKASWPDMQNELKKILRTGNCIVVGEALRKLHSNLQKKGEWYNWCLLENIADGNSWKREPLLYFAQVLRLDLMKAVLIATHCVEVSYAGNIERIVEENSEIRLLLRKTAAYVADWISARLAMTWPTISSAYAKTIAKDKSPIIESKEEYDRVAKALKLVLDEMGEAKYLHTVIVFPHWTDKRQVATICPSTFCFTLAKRAWEWFTPTINSEMHTYTIKWWENNKSKPLSGLALEMKQRFKGLCDPELYAHLVLIRNWMWLEVKATITLGVTETDIYSVKTQQGFDVKMDPLFADAEIFHVHMLL